MRHVIELSSWTSVASPLLCTKIMNRGAGLTSLHSGFGPFNKADELDLLGVAAASSDKILPLAVTAVEAAPALLPIAGGVVKAGPTPLLAGAVASLGAAGAAIAFIPDDSVTNIALQTALAVPLGAIIPGASLVGAGLLSKLK